MSKLSGPTMDDAPGVKPSPGITRVDLERGGFGASAVSVPKRQANEGMDTDYPTEGRRRNLNSRDYPV